MKKILLIFVALIITHCYATNILADEIYYIYIKPGDSKLRKLDNGGYLSIDYLCNCYAGKRPLHFEFPKKNENAVKDTLPVKYYTMSEFNDLANKMRREFKNHILWKANIYIIEQKENKFQYYKVQFAPVENEE